MKRDKRIRTSRFAFKGWLCSMQFHAPATARLSLSLLFVLCTTCAGTPPKQQQTNTYTIDLSRCDKRGRTMYYIEAFSYTNDISLGDTLILFDIHDDEYYAVLVGTNRTDKDAMRKKAAYELCKETR